MHTEIETFRFYVHHWRVHMLFYSSSDLNRFPFCLDVAVDYLNKKT